MGARKFDTNGCAFAISIDLGEGDAFLVTLPRFRLLETAWRCSVSTLEKGEMLFTDHLARG